MTDRNFKITGDDVKSRTAVKGEDLDQTNTSDQDKQQNDVNKQESNDQSSDDDSSKANSLDKSKTHVLNVSGIDSR